MKTFDDLLKDLNSYKKNVEKELTNALNETAEQVEEDVKDYAPYNSGDYVESIKKDEVEKTRNGLSVYIYTDKTVTALYTKKTYVLGQLLEYGTGEHFIPNAFGRGYTHGYMGSDGKWHKGTMDKDWHPGFVAIEHWHPALDKNKELFNRKISEALERVKL